MAYEREVLVAVLLAGCSPHVGTDAGVHGYDVTQHPTYDSGFVPTDDGIPPVEDTPVVPTDAPPMPGCSTRVFYGSRWVRPPGHTNPYDDATSLITWDGVCTDDPSGTSSATLSNGWRPTFTGHGGCVIDLEYSAACHGVPTSCTTRVTYGPSWLRPAGHAAPFDDAPGPVIWGGNCHTASATESSAELSNGWSPHFMGPNGCEVSIRYESCTKGLFANPVVASDCPDPGVIYDGTQYVMACTSGGAPDAFPIRTSADLVNWTAHGAIFPFANRPTWASGDFWAPEIHHVGGAYVAYFAALDTMTGRLSIGAASATSATGPFNDIGHPLVQDSTSGIIDPTEFAGPDGTQYLLWKVDGIATGQPTPIRVQQLAADGLSVTGTPATLISNNAASWEGPEIQSPWMVQQGGMYYLFYTGNIYNTAAYGLGVARSSSPLGPFTKAPGPILVSNNAWQGAGAGSVITSAGGDSVIVYASWAAGHLGASPPGREVLVDRVSWVGGWPALPQAPSSLSQPLP